MVIFLRNYLVVEIILFRFVVLRTKIVIMNKLGYQKFLLLVSNFHEKKHTNMHI